MIYWDFVGIYDTNRKLVTERYGQYCCMKQPYYEWAKLTKFLLSAIHMGRFEDIQTALKFLKKSEKIEIHF